MAHLTDHNKFASRMFDVTIERPSNKLVQMFSDGLPSAGAWGLIALVINDVDRVRS